MVNTLLKVDFRDFNGNLNSIIKKKFRPIKKITYAIMINKVFTYSYFV